MEDTNITVEEQGTNTAGEQAQARTFTQEEVNAIVQSRIGDIKDKYHDYEGLKSKAQKYDEQVTAFTSVQTERDSLKTELESLKAQNALRAIREQVSSETGVPTSILEFASNEEDCRRLADAYATSRQNSTYPSVRDAGENIKPQKKDAVSQFEDWFNKSTNPR